MSVYMHVNVCTIKCKMIVQTSTMCNLDSFVVQVIVLVLEFFQMQALSAE